MCTSAGADRGAAGVELFCSVVRGDRGNVSVAADLDIYCIGILIILSGFAGAAAAADACAAAGTDRYDLTAVDLDIGCCGTIAAADTRRKGAGFQAVAA